MVHRRKLNTDETLLSEILQSQQEIISRLSIVETKLSSMEAKMNSMNEFVYGNGKIGFKTIYDFARITAAGIGAVIIYILGETIVQQIQKWM